MIRYEDQCVGCPPEMGCLGDSCHNRNVKIYECDECHDEVGELYSFDGEELCLECVAKRLERTV